MPTKKKTIWIVLGVVALVVFALFYYFVDPSAHMWVPKCPFLLLTGLKCPGCGSQRAIHACLHGQWHEIWHYNALFIPAIIYIVCTEVAKLTNKKVYGALTGMTASTTWLIVVVLFAVLRNIFNF